MRVIRREGTKVDIIMCEHCTINFGGLAPGITCPCFDRKVWESKREVKWPECQIDGR